MLIASKSAVISCNGANVPEERECDTNDDCSPGLICKVDDSLFGRGTGHCTEDFWTWQCDQYPQWLQKTYRIRAINFCKDQWNGYQFNSQPECNKKVLPTISFYDSNANELLCVLNMNEMTNPKELSEKCSQVVSELNSDQEVWVVYIVHGFSDTPIITEYYPQYRSAIGGRYRKGGRKIIVGEVDWKDGSKATFDWVSSLVTEGLSLKHKLKPLGFIESFLKYTIWDTFGCSLLSNAIGYSKSASNTMVVGHALGKLTETLYAYAANAKLKTFCIGHSHGSHVCGFSGKTRIFDGIIGIGPSSPIFKNNFVDGRLSKEDAKMVQVLHFNVGILGITDAIGDQDIFINSGKNQPGCEALFSNSGCSHGPFAINFFLKMLKQTPEIDLCYAQIKCESEIQAIDAKIESCVQQNHIQVQVGDLTDTVTDHGIFYLNTKTHTEDPCYLTINSLPEDAYGM